MKRKIIQIDEDKCNGCGQCVPGCAEGALQVIDGKAKLVSDVYCDGLGACLRECPQDALKVIERDADGFDEQAVQVRLEQLGRPPLKPHQPPAQVVSASPSQANPPQTAPHSHGGGCPGTALRTMNRATEQAAPADPSNPPPSSLAHWPVQLMLVPSHAPFLRGADILLCADCVPFTLPDFHSRYLQGRALLVGCPKLDDVQFYQEKLTEIFKEARPQSVTVLRMEVPCCGGLAQVAQEARRLAGADTRLEVHVISIQGGVVSRQPIA